MAKRLSLDLVEISPKAKPPVCKVVDYSKFAYQLKKKKKIQKANTVKTVNGNFQKILKDFSYNAI